MAISDPENQRFKEALYAHGFNLMPQFGPARLMKLYSYFGGWQNAYEADAEKIAQAGIEPELAAAFITQRGSCDLAAQAEILAQNQIKLLAFTEANYPKLLLEISKFPPLLYYRGLMESADELCIAVVGTRMITNYGRIATPQLLDPLIDAGAIIVSGMAFGVDSAAHTAMPTMVATG